MPAQSTRELENRLETTLRSVEDVEAEIGRHDVGREKAVALQQLLRANLDLALALQRSIAEKVGAAAPCRCVPIRKEFYEAEMDLAVSEGRLGVSEDGSSTQRERRFELAEERWWSALDAWWAHRSTCQICLASRSR